jgi:hypothetical protein
MAARVLKGAFAVASWCDKLASTPTVGLKLSPHYASSDALLDSLSPLLNKWASSETQNFNLERQESFAVTLNTDDGYVYTIEPERINVGFKHKVRVVPVSAGPPVLRMLSEPLPYSQLLPQVVDRLVDVFERLPGRKDRPVDRIGIVATTIVAEDDMPPGIRRFIEYVSRPWNGIMDAYSIRIVGALGSSSNWKDRCVHHVSKAEDEESLMSITLDWQRVLTPPSQVSRVSLTDALYNAQHAALGYFEEVAEGGRFDEELIRSSAHA